MTLGSAAHSGVDERQRRHRDPESAWNDRVTSPHVRPLSLSLCCLTEPSDRAHTARQLASVSQSVSQARRL
jgi:hypothetical protein